MAKPTVYSTYPDINPAQALRLIGTRRALSPRRMLAEAAHPRRDHPPRFTSLGVPARRLAFQPTIRGLAKEWCSTAMHNILIDNIINKMLLI